MLLHFKYFYISFSYQINISNSNVKKTVYQKLWILLLLLVKYRTVIIKSIILHNNDNITVIYFIDQPDKISLWFYGI